MLLFALLQLASVFETVNLKGSPTTNTAIFLESRTSNPLDNMSFMIGQTVGASSQLGSPNEPRTNVVTKLSVNLDGSGNIINTNMSALSLNYESTWQNLVDFSQSELHWTWNSPFTQWGTNFGWRFLNFTPQFDTATRVYLGSQFEINTETFQVDNPRRLGGEAPFKVSTSPAWKGANLDIFGTIITRGNSGTVGGVLSYGGVLTAANIAGNVNVALRIQGTPPYAHLYPGSGYPKLMVDGFDGVTFGEPVTFSSNISAFTFTDLRGSNLVQMIQDLQARIIALEQR